MRVALNEELTLTKTFDVEGVAVDNGTVTVTVKRDGVTVSTGTATNDENVYSYALPAQDTLGQLEVIWAGTRTERFYIEVVGFHLCELSDIRNRWLVVPQAKTRTDAQLRAARDVVADTFDRVCGTSFVPRRVVELVDAMSTYGPVGTYGLTRVVTVNGEPFTATRTTRTGVYGLPAWQTSTVVYEAQEFGAGNVPADVANAAVEYAIALLGAATSKVPSNVETMQTDEATYRMVVPGQRGSETGIPKVDTVLSGYMRFTNNLGGIY